MTTEQSASAAESPSSTDKWLDEQFILSEARKLTGADRRFEAGLGDRLQRLLHHFDADLKLDDNGRRMAHDTVCDLLVNRTKLLADRERYPAIEAEMIRQPLIVTGLPRSGTTLLHSLIAADPFSRSPEWWEVLRPSPPPGIAMPDDPRIARADRELAELIALQPRMLQSHPYFDAGGHALMEDEAFGVTDFRHILRSVFYRVPAVPAINLNLDPLAFYQYHRTVLQALQWRRPVRRWALKGTEHHVRLEALKTVYPDAIVVWLHRDPLKVFPSVMELLASLYEGIAGSSGIDRAALGRQVLARYKSMLDVAMSSPLINHPDIYHLRYSEFSKAPIDQIKLIYDRYGIPFTGETRVAMTAWYSDPANKGDRHGKFTYALESFGVPSEYIEEETRAYRERFDIPFER